MASLQKDPFGTFIVKSIHKIRLICEMKKVSGKPGHGLLLLLLQIFLFDQENFQGRMMEVQNECMNVCERGMDRVRSIIVECGP